MKKSKILSTLALSTALLIPSTAFAQGYTAGNEVISPQATGWQQVGIDYIVLSSSMQSDIIYSGGGDFRADFYQYQGNLSVELWENDPEGNQLVRSARTVYGHYGNNSLVWTNIGSFVDGTNNKAEFFLKIKPLDGTGGTLKIEFYD
jgi:hypothetical protein